MLFALRLRFGALDAELLVRFVLALCSSLQLMRQLVRSLGGICQLGRVLFLGTFEALLKLDRQLVDDLLVLATGLREFARKRLLELGTLARSTLLLLPRCEHLLERWLHLARGLLFTGDFVLDTLSGLAACICLLVIVGSLRFSLDYCELLG